jgi:hypothetical protein
MDQGGRRHLARLQHGKGSRSETQTRTAEELPPGLEKFMLKNR